MRLAEQSGLTPTGFRRQGKQQHQLFRCKLCLQRSYKVRESIPVLRHQILEIEHDPRPLPCRCILRGTADQIRACSRIAQHLTARSPENRPFSSCIVSTNTGLTPYRRASRTGISACMPGMRPVRSKPNDATAK